MGRRYTIPIDAVAVTAVQDLFEVKAATGKPFWLRRVVVTQHTDYGDAQAEGLRFRVKKATGAYTTGSGGTTPTAQQHMSGDSAFGGTAKINNTTQAVAGSGAIAVIQPEAANIQGGYENFPTTDDSLYFAGGTNAEACIVDLPTAPADSITVSGYMVVEELG
jgi:hypothetical protein